jgi:hypothetical protein
VILARCVSALIFEHFANAGALRECLNIEDFAENFKSHPRLFQLTAQADP